MKLRLLISLMVATSFLFAQNLINNSGFEEGFSGWQKIVTRGADVTFSLDNQITHSGKTSLRISNASVKAPNVFGTLWQSLKVEPGKTYLFSAWLRGQNAAGTRLTIDKKWSVRKGPPEGSFDWQEITLRYTVPPDESTIEPRLLTENFAACLWLDDVRVTEEKAPVDSTTLSLQDLGRSFVFPARQLSSANKIKIDGDLSDWKGASGMILPSKSEQVEIKNWRGKDDLSAKVYMSWDESAFYFSALVTDDQTTSLSGESLYAGDSIQIGFGSASSYGPEYGFSAGDQAPSIWCWQKGSASLETQSLQLAVSKKTGETTYEVAIPWKAIFQDGRPPSSLALNFLINDNDGSGRRGWIEWHAGIGRTKDPIHFPKVLLVPAEKRFGIYVEEPAESFFRGDKISLSAYVYSFTNASQNVFLSLPIRNMELKLDSMSLVKNTFGIELGNTGEVKKTVSLRLNDFTEVSESVLHVFDYNADSLKEKLGALRNLYSDLEKKAQACEKANLPYEREQIDLVVIKQFIDYGIEDAVRGRLERSAYVLTDLGRRIAKTDQALQGLLNHSVTPRHVMKYAGGGTTISNGHFVAEQTAENGLKKTHPFNFWVTVILAKFEKICLSFKT